MKMNRIFTLALILLCLTCFPSAVSAGPAKANCSYFGEPHLIPFPTPAYPIQNQYVCLPTGSEVLLANQFIEIDVTVALTGNHPITQYTLTVFPNGPYSGCVITDSLTSLFPPPPSCLPGSGATVTVTGSSLLISLSTASIQVTIDRQPIYFDIYITQPSPLIAQSKGVCVNWQCALEIPGVGRKKRQTQTDPTIAQISNIFVDGARQGAEALGPVDENAVQSRTVASNYDIGATVDARYGQTIVLSVIRTSVQQFEDDPNYADYWSQAVTAAQAAICDADQKVNNLIASSDPVCINNEQGEQQCLQPIDDSAQCPGRRKK